jgi:hypothetical protein
MIKHNLKHKTVMKRSTSGQAAEKEIHRLKDFPAKRRMEGSFGVIKAKDSVIFPAARGRENRRGD